MYDGIIYVIDGSVGLRLRNLVSWSLYKLGLEFAVFDDAHEDDKILVAELDDGLVHVGLVFV
jgi:hypothetical protein